jgi:L-ribulokinase
VSNFTIGIDFGTESGRAVLVDVATGRELTSAVYKYSHGVIDDRLPESNKKLPHDWALQDPDDYLRALKHTIPACLKAANVKPVQVVGLAIDFTACTMLPTLADGTPLCRIKKWRANPHAWVKLWKHHAAQPQADKINATARKMKQAWLARYGGKISSEWFFSKALQILEEAPAVYAAADRLIEAADWVIWQLTGRETRNNCTAGYKAIWEKREGFPPKAFFRALDKRFENVVDEKMMREISPIGAKAGELTAAFAKQIGLLPGTAVAVANVDAHVAVPAVTVVEPGRLVMIMGTSICHMVLGTQRHIVEGMCGYVEDGIIPGFLGYEAGQSGAGDILAWFVENCVPGKYDTAAKKQKLDIHGYLEKLAAQYQVGEAGVLCLDWFNGNRSVLVDADLTGLMVGMNITTPPQAIYRGLIESIAFGTNKIIENFAGSGVPIRELVACGGMAVKNKLLMQIFADVTGRTIKVGKSDQAGALGSAMFAAVAAGKEAGGYDTIFHAAKKMAHLRDTVYRPNRKNHQAYKKLYREYETVHDYFGRGANPVMKRMKAMKNTEE